MSQTPLAKLGESVRSMTWYRSFEIGVTKQFELTQESSKLSSFVKKLNMIGANVDLGHVIGGIPVVDRRFYRFH